jgi:hypothetical protein
MRAKTYPILAIRIRTKQVDQTVNKIKWRWTRRLVIFWYSDIPLHRLTADPGLCSSAIYIYPQGAYSLLNLLALLLNVC